MQMGQLMFGLAEPRHSIAHGRLSASTIRLAALCLASVSSADSKATKSQ